MLFAEDFLNTFEDFLLQSFGFHEYEFSSSEIVEGTEGDGNDSARQTNDIVGHAEVWYWQVHQQSLCVNIDNFQLDILIDL